MKDQAIEILKKFEKEELNNYYNNQCHSEKAAEFHKQNAHMISLCVIRLEKEL